jgi:hypothetical protein
VHGLTLPEGRDRQEYATRAASITCADPKWNCSRAAQYRVTFTEDLKQDAGDANRFKDDLRSLKEQGLIEERS